MLYIRCVLLLLLLINKLLLWPSSLSLRNRAALHHLWSWVLRLWWLVLVCVLGWLSRVHYLLLLLFQTPSSNRTWSHRTIIILILGWLLIHSIILDVRLRVIFHRFIDWVKLLFVFKINQDICAAESRLRTPTHHACWGLAQHQHQRRAWE